MSKAKGSRTERELVHLLHQNNWASIRIAGSGSSPLPSPDLIAGKAGRVLAIECKSGKGKRYLDKGQINELKEFSDKFGAEPWIAVRFDGKEWSFLKIDELKKSGNSFSVDINLAKEKGINLQQLLNLK